jgi:hypothetical protein
MSELSADITKRIDASSGAVKAFRDALVVAELAVPELVAAGLLPATVSWSAIDNALRRVNDKTADGEWWKANLPVFEIFAAILRRCGRPLSRVITLVMQLRHDLERPPSLQSLIPRLAGLIDFAAVVAGRDIEIPVSEVSAFPSDDASNNLRWKEELESLRDKLRMDPRSPFDARAKVAWGKWSDRMANHLSRRHDKVPVISYEDLVLAAGDPILSTLFRSDIARMTSTEWTRLCLRGAESAAGGSAETPGWTCCAALVALRFGPDVVWRVQEDLRPIWGERAPSLERFFPSGFTEGSFTANAIRPLIIAPGGSLTPATARGPSRPHLLVADREVLELYCEALTWLKSRGVFDEVIIGETDQPMTRWTELLRDLNDLPRRSFLRRLPETHEESLRDDIIFGVKGLDDLLERADKRSIVSREKPPR